MIYLFILPLFVLPNRVFYSHQFSSDVYLSLVTSSLLFLLCFVIILSDLYLSFFLSGNHSFPSNSYPISLFSNKSVYANYFFHFPRLCFTFPRLQLNLHFSSTLVIVFTGVLSVLSVPVFTIAWWVDFFFPLSRVLFPHLVFLPSRYKTHERTRQTLQQHKH